MSMINDEYLTYLTHDLFLMKSTILLQENYFSCEKAGVCTKINRRNEVSGREVGSLLSKIRKSRRSLSTRWIRVCRYFSRQSKETRESKYYLSVAGCHAMFCYSIFPSTDLQEKSDLTCNLVVKCR